MKYIKIILIPIIFAIGIRLIFGADIFDDFISVMSWTFFITTPAGIGALMIYFSPAEKVESLKYRIFYPWIPVFLVLAITMVLMIEGWACWLMILPLFLIFASIGGLTAGYFKLKNRKSENLNISILVLLPFLIGPIEHSINTNKQVFRTYTSIVINGEKETIWNNVTNVRAISNSEDNSQLTKILGFPRPVEATLDKNEIGGYREAKFEKGLIFHETVTEYKYLEFMKFKIKANTYEIPSTTLDRHILIGGQYFDMLDGTYELKKIDSDKYKLILYSNFSLNTTFNFYAGIWGKFIMKDIQNNILEIIKERSEKTFANNGSSPISGSVRKKIINLTNKPILSRQFRVAYSANWR
ncbi:hypothetical protein [Christiangramia sp. OXR-203]|uniref:hypothetical protein n=1 Tax=Christiangramia sp. OXR-203 TaxID=3100176 RepID=UPI002AC95B23|nr:hypothetical protein [Christiangramia sp. OXR-203]WPY97617.1 hypothetical protein T8I65_10570 [Christiangramia sp. OXR-203]